MSSPLPEDDGFWKIRHDAAVREFEQDRDEAEQRTKLLCRTIIRLTLATSGLDPVLDPHLGRLRDLLRKGVVNEKLGRELDSVSDTLLREAKDENRNSRFLKKQAAVLFRFLKETATSVADRQAVAQLEARVEQGEITQIEPLFSAIQAILRQPPSAVAVESDEHPKPGLFSRWFSRGDAKPRDAGFEINPLRERLLAVLDVIEVPAAFADSAETLRRRLTNTADFDQLQILFTGAIDFFGKIRAYILREQQEIESFLGVLTGRLTELERHAVGADASAQACLQDRRVDDDSFSSQFAEFRDSARQASDLSQLKALVQQRLEGIGAQLRASREREAEQLRETQNQLGELGHRLHDLELETTELRTKLRVAHDMALRDSLTGLPNRKAYDERLVHEIARWKRFNLPFSLLFFDVDHFKTINDRFGHAAGDQVLEAIGRALAKSVRETDFVARYGGEEFAVILCGAPGDAALRVAETIRHRIGRTGFNSRGRPVPVTVSCGVSEIGADDTSQLLFDRADRALYQAKQAGRDRCVLC